MARAFEFLAEACYSAAYSAHTIDDAEPESGFANSLSSCSAPRTNTAGNPGRNVGNEEGRRSDDVKSILIVSQDDDLRPMIRSFLEHLGFAAFSCADASHALQILSGDNAVHLLLLDANTLGAAGVALAAQCADEYPQLPVIVLKDAEEDDGDLQSIACRGWVQLRRPVQLPDVLGAIQKTLESDEESRDPLWRTETHVLRFARAETASYKNSAERSWNRGAGLDEADR